MASVDWRKVPSADFRVPDTAPLADLTAELTGLLGATDPRVREDVAVPVLTTWISRGVYDDLLVGLGDGIATGLMAVLKGEDEQAVFRRATSATVLGACIERDTARQLVSKAKVVEWGDRLATWLLAERDLRGYVPGCGWAHAVARVADALGALAASPRCGPPELSVVLEVLGERVVASVVRPWEGGEADHLAAASVRLLRRDLVPVEEVEHWAASIGEEALSHLPGVSPPSPSGANADAFLRALHLQLTLAPRPPARRADLVLALAGILRELHPELGAAPPSAR